MTFSFKTNSKDTGIEQRIQDIRKLGRKLNIPEAVVSRTPPSGVVPKKVTPFVHRGSGETSIILEKLDQGIMNSEFFVSPRSTGDVVAELRKRTGMGFAPRKVSQALGVLQKKGVLGRVGTKGKFQYFRR